LAQDRDRWRARNVDQFLPDYKAQNPWRQSSPYSPPWETEISQSGRTPHYSYHDEDDRKWWDRRITYLHHRLNTEFDPELHLTRDVRVCVKVYIAANLPKSLTSYNSWNNGRTVSSLVVLVLYITSRVSARSVTGGKF
jgi:hypothetical protein